MILGTKARYAVMAMVELAIHSKGAPVKLAKIAEHQEISLPYLEQIFAKLRQSGIVRSVKGPGGGYVLARPVSEISIAAIMMAAEENIKTKRCNGELTKGCMVKSARCLTHDLWDGLDRNIEHYFKQISLEDVCSKRLGNNHTN